MTTQNIFFLNVSGGAQTDALPTYFHYKIPKSRETVSLSWLIYRSGDLGLPEMDDRAVGLGEGCHLPPVHQELLHTTQRSLHHWLTTSVYF